MLNHLVCGTFPHEEDGSGPCSSPRKTKRKDNNRSNNPYASRGLDKFSSLLADLDLKRKKVYSQMSPQEISFVRFAYSNTDDFVPIVVKVKNRDQRHKSEELKVKHLTSFSEPMDQKPVEEEIRKQHNHKLESNNHNKKDGFSWDMVKRPSFYVPAVMMLILVLLTVFGRSVATLCTCIVWYIVPVLKDYSSKPVIGGGKVSMKIKKDYVRGLSEKKMVTEELLSPRRSGGSKHGHQKSW